MQTSVSASYREELSMKLFVVSITGFTVIFLNGLSIEQWHRRSQKEILISAWYITLPGYTTDHYPEDIVDLEAWIAAKSKEMEIPLKAKEIFTAELAGKILKSFPCYN